jgi:hypothetical protein
MLAMTENNGILATRKGDSAPHINDILTSCSVFQNLNIHKSFSDSRHVRFKIYVVVTYVWGTCCHHLQDKRQMWQVQLKRNYHLPNYKVESNENLKSAIKIRNTAWLSCKLAGMMLIVWRMADRWQYDAGMQRDSAVLG